MLWGVPKTGFDVHVKLEVRVEDAEMQKSDFCGLRMESGGRCRKETIFFDNKRPWRRLTRTRMLLAADEARFVFWCEVERPCFGLFLPPVDATYYMGTRMVAFRVMSDSYLSLPPPFSLCPSLSLSAFSLSSSPALSAPPALSVFSGSPSRNIQNRQRPKQNDVSPGRGSVQGGEGHRLVLDRLLRQWKDARREGGCLPRQGRQRQGRPWL